MHFHEGADFHHPMININNYLPAIGKDEIIQNILTGLFCDNKHISSIYFYDEAGSNLFEEITRLPEYYIPCTEKPLIREAATRLKETLKNVDIIELGSGDCSKISIFLELVPKEHLHSIRYIPVDISHSAIMETVDILPHTFPGLKIYGILADFVKQVDLIPNVDRHIFCLFGSTIGNLTREQGIRFCSEVSNILRPDDVFLLGMDMVKDRDILFKAYNDSRNVTARFNKNILNVVNNLIETSFDPEEFEHIAFFNEDQARIEMHLKAMKNMETTSPYSEKKISMKKGETIHTENSHKFTIQHIRELEKAAGFKARNIYTDKNNWFSLVEFIKSESKND